MATPTSSSALESVASPAPPASSSEIADTAPPTSAAQSSSAVEAAVSQSTNEFSTEPDSLETTESLLPLPDLEADDGDSAVASLDYQSSSTSISSSVYAGYVENGRRYQTLREGHSQYPVPSDDPQFESMEAGHLCHLILESQQKNPFFRSPISAKAQNVLDLGTGQGDWAQCVADQFPQLTVRGIDLYPPPQKWVSPNCIFEVDDMTRPWDYKEKFDLIHMRLMLGSFPYEQWDRLYKRAYHHLAPGGWIEHVDVHPQVYAVDDSLPADSILAGYGKLMHDCAMASGNPVDIIDTMRERIENAGFINVHEVNYKIPVGEWPKLRIYKDAGKYQMEHYKLGLEGWFMWLLTKFGTPTPWTVEEAQIYLAKFRNELKENWHIYNNAKRVWAQKPYDTAPPKRSQPVVENLEENAKTN